MRGSVVIRWICPILLAAALNSCGRTDEHVIRHVVTAELMERYKVNEDRIQFVEIRLEDASTAVVRAQVHPGGRAGWQKTVTCRLKRAPQGPASEPRWVVVAAEST